MERKADGNRSGGAAAGAPARRPDIVCLGTAPWLLVHSVAEYTAQIFSREHRVLFVEPFNSLITLRHEARLRRPLLRGRKALHEAQDNLWIYSPPALGLPGASIWRWPGAVNGRILALLLRNVVHRLGFARPIIWTFLYNSAPVAFRLPPLLTVYDCIDNDEALAPSERRRRLVRSLEQDLCRRADLVFTVTEELAVPRRSFNPHTRVVNCAADLEFFGRAALEETPVPEDIARLPKPVLGYLGGIDPWKIDIGLLLHLARANPDWSIALVGYIWFGFDPAPLRGCPNIHFLGPKPHEMFPGYLKGMDVCLMPFPLNDITRFGDALKCYEYLAGGKPVVSTPVPAARRFSRVVRIAETPAAFVEAVRESLQEPKEASLLRREAVQPHSWEARAAQKMGLIRERLAEKYR